MSYDYSDNPNTDHSGNYGTVFGDFDSDGDVDLYIANAANGSTTLTTPAINQLWVNDGQVDGPRRPRQGTRPFEQSWTADFGDIDNDGDMDLAVTNHSTPFPPRERRHWPLHRHHFGQRHGSQRILPAEQV